MSCDDLKETMAGLAMGVLDEAEAEAVRTHVAHCAECATVLAAEEALEERLRAGIGAARARMASPAGLKAGIRAALEQRSPAGADVSGRLQRGWRPRLAMLLAAAASLLLATSLWVGVQPTGRSEAPEVAQGTPDGGVAGKRYDEGTGTAIGFGGGLQTRYGIGGGAGGAYTKTAGSGQAVPAPTTALPMKHGYLDPRDDVGGGFWGDVPDNADILVLAVETDERRRTRGRRQPGQKPGADAPDTGESEEETAPDRPEAGPVDDEARQGELHARDAEGEPLGLFPLQRTLVAAEVSGYLATTRVTQQYANPFEEKIEAVYVFPLPQTAAVNGFEMRIGDRTIIGVVREREEARRIYEQARARGHVASLLEQERPNIFTQSVANIEPGKRVDIDITYFHTLPYENGTYSYVFPMVVGHRYGSGPAVPSTGPGSTPTDGGTSDPEPSGGGGIEPDTARSPDHSKVTPPRVHPDTRSGHDIELTVTVDAGVPIEQVECPSHQVDLTVDGARATISLKPEDRIANKDFVLEYQVGGEAPKIGLLAHRGPEGGYLSLLLEPQIEAVDADVVPRELFFILDTSGSMGGVPMEKSKQLMRRALDAMRPNDVFNIATFAGSTTLYSDEFLSNTPDEVKKARAFVETLRGAGGTEMQKGIELALNHPRDPERVRIVVFLTDGGVSFEGDIFQRIERSKAGARIFSFGIGSSVNRYLLERMAEHGNGAATIILLGEPAERIDEKVARFYQRIDAPVLVDVEIDWGGHRVEDVYPRRLPDLFVGRPVHVHARFEGGTTGPVTIRGLAGGERFQQQIEVTLPTEAPEHEALGPVWARMRIKDLMDEAAAAEPKRQEAIVGEITDLALDFQLVTQYTSFVAVDSESDTGEGAPVRVMQPVEVPAGVDPSNFGINEGEEIYRLGAWGATLAEDAQGRVVILEVHPGSPLAEAGVQPGATLEVFHADRVQGIAHLKSLTIQEALQPPHRLRFRQGTEAVELEVP